MQANTIPPNAWCARGIVSGDAMNVLDLYDEICTTTNAANTPEMERAFLAALKRVVNDLNYKLRETVIAPIAVDNEDIGFEAYCDNTFHPGVKFYMQRMGAWAQDPDAESYNFYQTELRRTVGYAINADTTFLTRNEE